MKHRKLVKGMSASAVAFAAVVLLTFAICLGACDTGSQETKFIKIGAPDVAIKLLSNYGVELTWEHGLDIGVYVIYRTRGDWPAEMIGVLDYDDLDRFGKYTFEDIVETNTAGEGSLKSDTEYDYTVYVIPRGELYTIRDANFSKMTIKTGEIVPQFTPSPVGAVSVAIDGETRSVKATAVKPTAATIEALPIEGVEYKITLYRNGVEFASQAGFDEDNDTFSPAIDWEGGDAEGSWTAKVETQPIDTRNGYFIQSDPVYSTSAFVYAYPFDRRYPNALLATYEGSANGFIGTFNPTTTLGLKHTVSNFITKINFEGIRGLPGVTYTLQRRTGTTWTDIDLYDYTAPAAAPTTGGTGKNYEVNYTKRASNDLFTDIYGVFEPDISFVYDINLPVAKADYRYRLKALVGANFDYVDSNAASVPYSNEMDYDGLRVTGAKSGNLYGYTLEPRFDKTGVDFPGMWTQGLTGNQKIEVYWALVDDGDTGYRYGWNETNKVSFTKDELELYAKRTLDGATVVPTDKVINFELTPAQLAAFTGVAPGLYLQYFYTDSDNKKGNPDLESFVPGTSGTTVFDTGKANAYMGSEQKMIRIEF